GRWWRWLTCWFADSVMAITAYRLSRAMYLLLGPAWPAVSVVLLPLSVIARPWLGRCDIHYKADIGGGLLILHPALGVVVSGYAIVGSRLTLTGGNCI